MFKIPDNLKLTKIIPTFIIYYYYHILETSNIFNKNLISKY